MSQFEPPPEDKDQPWWNDADKVGGAVATLVLIAFAGLVIAFIVRIAVWIWP